MSRASARRRAFALDELEQIGDQGSGSPLGKLAACRDRDDGGSIVTVDAHVVDARRMPHAVNGSELSFKSPLEIGVLLDG